MTFLLVFFYDLRLYVKTEKTEDIPDSQTARTASVYEVAMDYCDVCCGKRGGETAQQSAHTNKNRSQIRVSNVDFKEIECAVNKDKRRLD